MFCARFASGLLFATLCLLGSCASYSESTQAARAAYYAGNHARAKELFTGLLEGEGRAKDGPLLLLERAIVHMAAQQYEAAVQDLQQADTQLEVMDFTDDPAQIGRYLFSEDSGLYRGPPHEKILIPTLTSIAYAALGDLVRARTAANAAYSQLERFDAARPDADFASPLAYVLVGLAAELADDPQRAFVAYAKAYETRRIRALEPVLGRLSAENARRFGGHWLRDDRKRPPSWRRQATLAADQGELVVFVLNGRAPVRAATRSPMSLEQRNTFLTSAMAMLAQDHPEVDMVEAQQQIGAESLLPMAVLRERPSRYRGAMLALQGRQPHACEELLSISEQVRRWYRLNESTQVAAALSRFAVRVAARVGTYLVAKEQAGNAAFAFIVSLTMGALLEAADTPDTRCWALLPDTVLFARVPVRAGRVELQLRLTGPGGTKTISNTVDVEAGRPHFVVAVTPD